MQQNLVTEFLGCRLAVCVMSLRMPKTQDPNLNHSFLTPRAGKARIRNQEILKLKMETCTTELSAAPFFKRAGSKRGFTPARTPQRLSWGVQLLKGSGPNPARVRVSKPTVFISSGLDC